MYADVRYFCDVITTSKVVELKPGGNDIPVDNDNKHEYVQLIVRHRLVHGIKDQVRSLKTGFNEVVRRRSMRAAPHPPLHTRVTDLFL